jgi:hypothetical protein
MLVGSKGTVSMLIARSVLTLSPGFLGVRAGAITTQSYPAAQSSRNSRYPVGPAS